MSKMKFKPKTRILSGREARRYGERERQREQRQQDIDRFWALSPEERARRMADNEAFQRISRNGITLEDVKRAEDESYRNGVNVGMENTMKMCYAAMCLALNEMHGFGTKRCKDVLNAVDAKITMALTSEELVNEVFERMGLTINFKGDACEERIQENGA